MTNNQGYIYIYIYIITFPPLLVRGKCFNMAQRKNEKKGKEKGKKKKTKRDKTKKRKKGNFLPLPLDRP